MAQLREVFKCSVCGQIVEVLHAGAGQLVCCGLPMQLMAPNTVDASLEKHVPVLEEVNGETIIKVGFVAHPMEEKHYIEWIEAETTVGFCKKFLAPGEAPEFRVPGPVIAARAYCNLHGLWRSK